MPQISWCWQTWMDFKWLLLFATYSVIQNYAAILQKMIACTKIKKNVLYARKRFFPSVCRTLDGLLTKLYFSKSMKYWVQIWYNHLASFVSFYYQYTSITLVYTFSKRRSFKIFNVEYQKTFNMIKTLQEIKCVVL